MIGTVLGLFGRGTNTAVDLVHNMIYDGIMPGEKLMADAGVSESKVLGAMASHEMAKMDEYIDQNSAIIHETENLLSIEIDSFTPCLRDRSSGKIVDTHCEKTTPDEVKDLKKDGWQFDWEHESLKNSEVLKLTLKDDSQIQGLIAIENCERDKAYHISLAESAPHNKGGNQQYEGVGGHLFEEVG